ncbi:MAG: DUF6483 family protein [Defluviitaleaceae bacterium]|nr:DUF6483 family protein [Defluviitaleaceae bacterium]
MIRHEQDWAMRQIQSLVQFIARTILNKDHISYEIDEEAGQMGQLYNRLKELLLTDDICEAEDVLHDGFNESKDYLRLAMWFYNELNMMTDEELEASGFSRDEIYEGLRDVLHQSGISLPMIEI